MTQIDDNFQGVGKVVTDDASQDVKPLLVDPVTGRLLVDIVNEAHTAVAVSSKIDENAEGVSLAVTDDVSEDIKPLKVHPVSGALLVDLLIE